MKVVAKYQWERSFKSTRHWNELWSHSVYWRCYHCFKQDQCKISWKIWRKDTSCVEKYWLVGCPFCFFPYHAPHLAFLLRQDLKKKKNQRLQRKLKHISGASGGWKAFSYQQCYFYKVQLKSYKILQMHSWKGQQGQPVEIFCSN